MLRIKIGTQHFQNPDLVPEPTLKNRTFHQMTWLKVEQCSRISDRVAKKLKIN
jgi:hypothetical protein